jgi:hypothetical protein
MVWYDNDVIGIVMTNYVVLIREMEHCAINMTRVLYWNAMR